MRLPRRPLLRECDREDVISDAQGTVLYNFLQAPVEDVDGPSFPATETTDPWEVTDGAVE